MTIIRRFMSFMYDWSCKMMDSPSAQALYAVRGLNRK